HWIGIRARRESRPTPGSWERTPPKFGRESSHEPVGIPLNRPPGAFSPTGEEGRDDGVRFMEWGQAPTMLNRELERRASTCWCICNKRLQRWRRRFMGRGHLQNSDVNRSHEPIGIPLNRPPGTFSPTGEEGRDDGVRFMEWGQAPTTLKRELQRRECPGVV